jgi:antitoxin VapB
LYIKNPEAEALARELAQLTGESLTEAVRRALAERHRRLRPAKVNKRKQAKMMRDMRAILKRVDVMPVLDPRSPDEILGYGEDGLPH